MITIVVFTLLGILGFLSHRSDWDFTEWPPNLFAQIAAVSVIVIPVMWLVEFNTQRDSDFTVKFNGSDYFCERSLIEEDHSFVWPGLVIEDYDPDDDNAECWEVKR